MVDRLGQPGLEPGDLALAVEHGDLQGVLGRLSGGEPAEPRGLRVAQHPDLGLEPVPLPRRGHRVAARRVLPEEVGPVRERTGRGVAQPGPLEQQQPRRLDPEGGEGAVWGRERGEGEGGVLPHRPRGQLQAQRPAPRVAHLEAAPGRGNHRAHRLGPDLLLPCTGRRDQADPEQYESPPHTKPPESEISAACTQPPDALRQREARSHRHPQTSFPRRQRKQHRVPSRGRSSCLECEAAAVTGR